MSLKDQITEDMKNAMRAKEVARLGTIRLLLAAIKQREVDERIVMDDANVIATVEKMIKQRKDSISQFEKASRDDLVAIEAAEMVILQVGQFPKGKHDDLVDTVSMAMRHLRDTGVILRPTEWQAELEDSLQFKGVNKNAPLYPA